MIQTDSVTLSVAQALIALRYENKVLTAEVERLKAALSDISKIAFEPNIGDKVARETMRRISNNALKKEKGGEDE